EYVAVAGAATVMDDAEAGHHTNDTERPSEDSFLPEEDNTRAIAASFWPLDDVIPPFEEDRTGAIESSSTQSDVARPTERDHALANAIQASSSAGTTQSASLVEVRAFGDIEASEL